MAKYQQNDSEELQRLDFLQNIKSEQLLNAFEKLRPRQRKALELYYWYGYNHREVAQIMGCKRRNITDLIARAIGVLSKYLSN